MESISMAVPEHPDMADQQLFRDSETRDKKQHVPEAH